MAKSNAAKKENVDPKTDETDDEVSIDVEDEAETYEPNDVITLDVTDKSAANTEPNSRWGRIKFDEHGRAQIKVPFKDVPRVHELKLLSAADAEKYLHLVQETDDAPMQAEAQKLVGEIEVHKAVAERALRENLEMKVELESMSKRFDLQWGKHVKDTDEKITQIAKDNEDLRMQNKSLADELSKLKADAPKVETKTTEIAKK